MDKKEYIERGALLKTPPFTKYGGYPSEYVGGYLDCAEEARKAVNDAPAADVVSKGVYEQVQWERDMAMQQLEEHGIPFGAKADVVEVRHGEWVIKTDDYDNEYMMCSCCKDEFYPVDADTVDSTPNYCPTCGAKMDGERKEQI